MRITIATNEQYKESTKKGVGYEVKVSDETASKWRAVLKDYEKVQKEMSELYSLAYQKYFADFADSRRLTGKKPKKK